MPKRSVGLVIKGLIMRKFHLVLILAVFGFSCTKQEFQTNKSSSSSAISAASTSCSTLFTKSTLVKPKVDLLFVWDNTSSFNFVTDSTKASLSNLISSVSENFDYHILNAPLVPANNASMYEMSLIASDSSSVSGSALTILKSKESAISTLAFSQGAGSTERGIDRAYDIVTNNRSNGIFRDGAYTLIVMMSNQDDMGCEISTGYTSCTQTDKNNYLATKKQKYLCLRGSQNTFSCSGYPTLNSSMLRMISVVPLTMCSNGLNKINYNYKMFSKYLYETPYVTSTGTWTTTDDIAPDISGYPDNRNLCTTDMSRIFDSVNTAIKSTLIQHVYTYWPLASSTASVDPSTIQVTTSAGKSLTNNTCVIDNSCSSTPTEGFGYIGNQTNHATRTYPTAGEFYTGKMIQLYGTNGNDLVVYPTSLTVCYQEMKQKYGYIYLTNGEPNTTTIEVLINGVTVPQSTTNGWSYMGLQYMTALDSNLKIANLPANATSGYVIKLNGTYQVTNAQSVNIEVVYTQKSSN